MRIKGILNPYKHSYILGFLYFNQFTEPKRLLFVVDTGCTTTTITPNETSRLGINCRSLEPSILTVTATKKTRPYCIRDAVIVFHVQDDPDGEIRSQEFEFEKIDVLPPPKINIIFKFLNFLKNWINNIRGHEIEIQDRLSPNLLGMDFLKRFRYWMFTEIELILDTDPPIELFN